MKKLLTSILIFLFLTSMLGSSFANQLTSNVNIGTKPIVTKQVAFVNKGLAKKINKALFG